MDEFEYPRDFKGVWIPKSLWLNRKLTPLQKMLVAEIDSLSGKDGCNSSNAYLAKFFSVTEGRMAHMVSELRAQGVIEDVSFNGRERRIRIKADLSESNNAGGGSKQGRVVGTRHRLYRENKEEIKESQFLNLDSQTEAGLPFESEAFKNAWGEWEQHRKEIKKKITPTTRSKQLLQLRKIGERRAIAALNHSIEKGWGGIYEETNGKPLASTQTPSTPKEIPQEEWDEFMKQLVKDFPGVTPMPFYDHAITWAKDDFRKWRASRK